MFPPTFNLQSLLTCFLQPPTFSHYSRFLQPSVITQQQPSFLQPSASSHHSTRFIPPTFSLKLTFTTLPPTFNLQSTLDTHSMTDFDIMHCSKILKLEARVQDNQVTRWEKVTCTLGREALQIQHPFHPPLHRLKHCFAQW
ncbi:hypothetical protein Pmani_039961 [Petrolisthes manimaculis]|uniref:Uncharacterized protein n=1 Tax=Petrolisthes manimaculis TaxID=1843537 RepID=A0AAE1TKT0_9EUCA|nr:hypothetical protein Pmani_039961 [Petrolisthes manimaculis]